MRPRYAQSNEARIYMANLKSVLYAIETGGPGGAEKMLLSLIDSLDRTRFHPVACLLKTGWLHDQLQARECRVHVMPTGHAFDWRWLIAMERLLQTEGIDVIHAHEFFMNTRMTLLARRLGRKVITTVHGRNYYGETWLRRALYRRTAANSKMIAVSEGIREFLAQRVGISPPKVTVIRNGIDWRPFQQATETTARARERLDVRADQVVVGCVGNLYPVKGHLNLVQASAEICRQFPNAIFIFAGRGDMQPALAETSARLGTERNMRFLGFRDDTEELLAAMDVFVLPSLSEGLPLSLLEAMASSKAIVSTNVGGIPEVITDGQNGILVPPADPVALANAVKSLLANAPLRASLGRSASDTVRRRFDLSSMSDAYEALYEG